jgi:hypothetical protein
LFRAPITPFAQERAQYADVAGKVNEVVIGHWLLAKSACHK